MRAPESQKTAHPGDKQVHIPAVLKLSPVLITSPCACLHPEPLRYFHDGTLVTDAVQRLRTTLSAHIAPKHSDREETTPAVPRFIEAQPALFF